MILNISLDTKTITILCLSILVIVLAYKYKYSQGQDFPVYQEYQNDPNAYMMSQTVGDPNELMQGGNIHQQQPMTKRALRTADRLEKAKNDSRKARQEMRDQSTQNSQSSRTSSGGQQTGGPAPTSDDPARSFLNN